MSLNHYLQYLKLFLIVFILDFSKSFYLKFNDLEASQVFLHMIGVLTHKSLPLLNPSNPKLNQISQISKKFKPIERLINYEFQNPCLLINAFTHISFRKSINNALYLKYNEKNLFDKENDGEEESEEEVKINVNFFEFKTIKNKIENHCEFINQIKPEHFSYDRLEFLGDAVLEFIIGKYLYKKFEKESPSKKKKKNVIFEMYEANNKF